jgi:hypothetical protein
MRILLGHVLCTPCEIKIENYNVQRKSGRY